MISSVDYRLSLGGVAIFYISKQYNRWYISAQKYYVCIKNMSFVSTHSIWCTISNIGRLGQFGEQLVKYQPFQKRTSASSFRCSKNHRLENLLSTERLVPYRSRSESLPSKKRSKNAPEIGQWSKTMLHNKTESITVR